MTNRPRSGADWAVLIFVIAFLVAGVLAQKYFPPSLGVGGKLNIPRRASQ